MGDPASAAITAGGNVIGAGMGAIGQGRENRRQASAAGQQAATINELIENSIMSGAEKERAALGSATFRNRMGRSPDASRFDPRRDLTTGGRDVTQGGFDPRGRGRDISGTGFDPRGTGFDPRGRGRDIGSGLNISDRGFDIARGEYGGIRDATGRNRLLESAERIRDVDTFGLEAAAGRTLRQNQGALGAQLASAGAFGSGVNARQQRQLQADTFSNLAGQINQDRFQRQTAAAGLEGQAMADQLQREGLVLEDLFGRDQMRTQDQQARDLGMLGDSTTRDTAMLQSELARDLGFMEDRSRRDLGFMGDRTARETAMLEGNLARDLGFMGDRTARAGMQQRDELARATSMLGDELARDQMFVSDRFGRDQAVMQDQLARSGMLLDDQFRRANLAGELYQTEGFGFYDPKKKQKTNQGK